VAHSNIQEHHRIVEAGWHGEAPAGMGATTLLIVSKRHPAGFPMRDLGGPVVQRVAKERCREPAALDAFVATVMRRSLRACQHWPGG
jgi:hypothetical protein